MFSFIIFPCPLNYTILSKCRVTSAFTMPSFLVFTYSKKANRAPPKKSTKQKEEKRIQKHEVPKYSSALFFKYNTQLGPPFYVLLDTNFINFSIKNKIDIFQGLMDCLYAKCKYSILASFGQFWLLESFPHLYSTLRDLAEI